MIIAASAAFAMLFPLMNWLYSLIKSDGILERILIRSTMEIPLPTPFSVMRSPIHINNVEPAVKVTMTTAAFTKLNAISGETEESQVGQYFHIMETISQQKGCCEVRDGEYEYTIYTSCCNASQGIFYYTTYENRQITAVRMRPDMLERDQLIRYPMQHQEKIAYEN